MRIAQLGTFDVENYGDLLFPSLLQRCLGLENLEVIAVSPRGSPGIWSDGPPSISFRDLCAQAEHFDGIVVGGGNLIHCQPTTLEYYATGGVTPFLAYADFWLGAAVLAARHGLPLCWNAPGVAAPPDPRLQPWTDWAQQQISYWSVRDPASAALLGASSLCRVVPDTGLELAALWSRAELERAYAEAYAARGATPPPRTLVVHLKARYLEDSLEATLAEVRAAAPALDAQPILVAIGPCHGDDELARSASAQIDCAHLLVDRPASLREVAGLIACSVAYIGSSLHGMITAAAHSIPGLLVSSPGVAKFEGFLSAVGLQRWQVGRWQALEGPALALAADRGASFQGVRDRVHDLLQEHWRSMRSALQRGRRAPGIATLPALSSGVFFGQDPWRGLPYEETLFQAQALSLLARTREQGSAVDHLREGKRKSERLLRRRTDEARVKQQGLTQERDGLRERLARESEERAQQRWREMVQRLLARAEQAIGFAWLAQQEHQRARRTLHGRCLMPAERRGLEELAQELEQDRNALLAEQTRLRDLTHAEGSQAAVVAPDQKVAGEAQRASGQTSLATIEERSTKLCAQLATFLAEQERVYSKGPARRLSALSARWHDLRKTLAVR